MSDTTSAGEPPRNKSLRLALAIAVGLALAALPFLHYTLGQSHHQDDDGSEHVKESGGETAGAHHH